MKKTHKTTMRVFISDLSSTFAQELIKYCQEAELEVLGTATTKAQVALFKRKLQEHATSDRANALAEPVALQSDKAAWSRLVQGADIVVTSLLSDQKGAMEILKAFEKRPESSDENEDGASGGVKRFIALSSVLTWSKNNTYAKAGSSGEGGSPPIGHHEDSFKTRKPLRKYAELKTCETQILSANRQDELETYVVAAGLIYGGAQSNFHVVFRDAWMYPAKDLLVPSVSGGVQGGRNLLPMISVYDLVTLAFKLVTSPSALPKNYLVATDKAGAGTSLRDICTGVSILLGNGRLRDIANDEEADNLVLDEGDGLISPLQVNLVFDSEPALMNQLVAPEEWKHYDRGLLGHLAFFVNDFIQALDLRPLKTVVLGPPRVGKTSLSRELARKYYLPYLSTETLVAELFAGEPKKQDEQEEQHAASEDAVTAPALGGDEELTRLREELQDWNGSSQKSLAEIPPAALLALLRWKLCSTACRNQGYVLDGMPVSRAQAAQLFEPLPGDPSENAEEGEPQGDSAEGEGKPVDGDDPSAKGETGEDDGTAGGLSKSRSHALLAQLRPRRAIQVPNRVVILSSDRPLLEARAQALTEEEAEASGNTQSRFEARFTEFATESDALATFFEQRHQESDAEGLEVLELLLESEYQFRDSDAFDAPIQKYMEQGGRTGAPPYNFHPTNDERKQRERELAQQRQQEETRVMLLAQEQEEQDAAEQHARLAAEQARLELIQREERELLETRAKPLRAYLMDTVLPALTEGMLEVVKVQPDDPIDYLAEYLFQKGRELDDAGL